MKKCDIIIPVWNQLEVTRVCLDSLIKNTDFPYRLIIIDNNSEKETEKYLSDFRDAHQDKVLLIRNEENLGYIKATNQGMKAADGEYLCLLNNDTDVHPKWLTTLVEVAELEDDIGLVNPASNHFNMAGPTYKSDDDPLYMGMGRCIGFCVLVKRKVVDAIGYLDESFGLGYGDDIAYSEAAQNAGYRCVLAKKSYVFHHGKTSFGRDSKARKYARQQKKLAYEVLAKRPRIIAVLTNKVDTDKSKKIIKTLEKLADRGLRNKVILNYRPEKPPFEHMYMSFRSQNKIWIYVYSLFRFLVDGKTDFFVTDSPFLFNILKGIRNIASNKELLFFDDQIYGVEGPFSEYPDNIRSFHDSLVEKLGARKS